MHFRDGCGGYMMQRHTRSFMTDRFARARQTLYAAAATLAAAGCASAQQPTTPTPAPASAPVAALAAPALRVGDEAPDFVLAGATRYGLLTQPVRLRDYRGQTVVLAFFFKARTRG
jgi:hypothetical protein